MQIIYGVCQECEWKEKINIDNVRYIVKELKLQKEIKEKNIDINNDDDLMKFVNQYKCYYHGTAKGIMSLLMEFFINRENVVEDIISFRTDTGLYGIGIIPTFPWLHAESFKSITKEKFDELLIKYIKFVFNIQDEEISVREICLGQNI